MLKKSEKGALNDGYRPRLAEPRIVQCLYLFPGSSHSATSVPKKQDYK